MKYGIKFTKVQASGNDFIVIDNKNGDLNPRKLDYSAMAKDLCRRRLSVGADGILALESSAKGHLRMRIINPDGSEVAMCGNGARCTALYAASQGWGNVLDMETGAGIIKAEVSAGRVKLRMSDPKDIKMNIDLVVGKDTLKSHFMDSGVPHVVHIVKDLENFPVTDIGRKIREHGLFAPAGTNANFVGALNEKGASIRTYERGVEDETLACGTGTVASAVTLGLLGLAKSPVKMRTRGGEVLTVYFSISAGKVSDVYLEGEAEVVYVGRV